ncbi:MAG TPA: hypothetical protein VLB07_11140, partial [Woeseiaceae bacterium]|nr:hypothetical protein [Woeseiaceae bacterium]
MRHSNHRFPGTAVRLPAWALAVLAWSVIALAACSSGSNNADAPAPLAACDPGNAATVDDCGTVLVGFTDADGDFLNYTVDVLSLKLETAGGRVVETLPLRTRINFTDYVDLTELVSAASIPPGVYVAGSIRLDYSNAEVVVEANDVSKAALVVDSDGNALTEVEHRILLSDRDRLVITRGRPSLLTVDFDLEASHTVDVVSTPALATAEAFIVAEIDPVDTKEIRVRGALVDTNDADMYYTVAMRPFFGSSGDFGRMLVNVTDDTAFEVNGVEYQGVDGLRALDAAGRGTLTIAQGTLDVGLREFTADLVLAGSS